MKTVFISGGSRGIGEATVREFINKGYRVITTSTSGKSNHTGENVSTYKMELSDLNGIKELAEKLMADNIRIDILINNAATADKNESVLTAENLSKTLETNVVGTVQITLAFLPLLNSAAVIINMSSEFGALTEDWGFRVPSYRISKAAINMFTRNIYDYKDVKEKGIKVYSFDPGWVKTDMGGKDAEREPEEPAKELVKLAESGNEPGLFYRGLKVRNW